MGDEMEDEARVAAEAENEVDDNKKNCDDNDGDDDEDDAANDGEDDGVDYEDDGEDESCTNWDNSDSKGGDAPEFLFCGSVERKIPPCTMNATEGGAKDQQEQRVQVLGILMPWNVERRDMCGISRDGS